MHIKTKDLWLVKIDLWRKNNRIRVLLKEDVWEASAEVRTVNVNLAELGQVDFLTTGTIDLEARGLQIVTETNREDLLFVTESSRTEAINTGEILLINL